MRHVCKKVICDGSNNIYMKKLTRNSQNDYPQNDVTYNANCSMICLDECKVHIVNNRNELVSLPSLQKIYKMNSMSLHT